MTPAKGGIVNNNNRLELTWVGKEKRTQVEPRILLDDPALSYHAPARKSAADQFDNLLIQGDNLLALKALETEYSGKVKCVFIDPPYNTGSAFTHYDDGLEHSLWLSLMRDRLEILRRLLREDGSIWITIDDNECHYLKVLCDEVFGRSSFKTCIAWQRKYSVSNNAKGIASICDYILVYAKSSGFEPNLLPRSQESSARYSNPDSDPRGPWKAVDYLNQASPEMRPNLSYEILNPNTGEKVGSSSKAWKYEKASHDEHVSEGRIWWGRDGKNTMPALKLFLSNVRDGMTPHNWWSHQDAGHTDEAKKEMIQLYGQRNVFDTPKPERLLERILHIASNSGDLILDSFAGSGTTGAVAHKMGRRWIMVELGEHAVTHIVPRLKKVIDGSDPGGVTKATNWRGGGGFRFQRLAPSLLTKNQHDRWVISPAYNAEMLAEAMCKHLGFDYQPTPENWWMMGRSTERDYLCVTTDSLQQEDFEHLSQEVGNERSLLICCKAFMANLSGYRNLTVKKIPQAILDRCEWGKDDYSLQIAALPEMPEEEADDSEIPTCKPKAKSRKSKKSPMNDLFAEDAE
jgi:adenine-specific DNA-methyltransferase